MAKKLQLIKITGEHNKKIGEINSGVIILHFAKTSKGICRLLKIDGGKM